MFSLRRFAPHGREIDVKLGLRMLAKQPLITAVAVLALGLGIPASLTLFHAIGVIYGDLPIPEGDRVVGLRSFDQNARKYLLSSADDYERWGKLTSFQSIAAVRSYAVNVNAEEAGAAPVRAAE